jgi:Leucine-rich repeat (LRR) protein
MTDETVLRLTNGLKNEHIGEMKYLTMAEYVDIGHNEFLSDISFFEYMPNVKLIIGSGTAIKDVTALQNLKNLEFLELVFCDYLKDISPLAGCTGLKYLNISITRVSQLNQQIQQSAFLSEPVATGDSHTAENLRQEINDVLFNRETGLLNKKFFTPQDRQQVETTLAKAVVLSAIRAGRKSMDNAPVPMEEAYQKNSEATILEVKQNDNFRNLVGSYISPDGLRRFLVEQQYIGVTKDILSNAAKQAGNDQPMQQRQPEIQQKRENHMDEAQPAMNVL